ncbi:NAD(P)H-dependent glycerol-3-phosphate dehydrogenase [Lipingzhangella sp. LS1_29]|uniref:Glycerol-3-phosphate dehydrogenase [NAD(P)+] n=1 Tax=Lipingzhangella rawalii TaxID=2055835 RepID=A0ABU2H759_9ACTN|nr:NAD(P)H-dependent glycerol-3-phosphate dehydrogenase [Lipingzhangella rawalii]MDS1270454.1 NAD(P)H-dependent glycerol-3-phosphate dehydrogenase [Lipingzhangella rawalii]
MTKVAILGGGSWGTAFANVVADAGLATVTLWCRRPELAAAINDTHINPDYFPQVQLNPELHATTDPAQALAGAEFVVLAVPSQSLRDNLDAWRPHIPPDAVIVSLIKGVELGTTLRMSEVVRSVLNHPADQVAVVSGPNLAGEIAERQPATAVVACPHEATAVRLQHICKAPYFRPYTHTDLVGAELGGAVKNVIALAVGVAVGLGFGDNAKASLITRGLAETVRLAVALGADEHTLAGLAGMGDLVATCSSPLSRNRTFGEKLGSGMSVADVIAETRQTAEGVRSARAISALARDNGVDMPITETVVAMVDEGLPPEEALVRFMSRSAKPERYGVG